MAALKNHGGIDKIFVSPTGGRYALCKDGKVLVNLGFGWKVAKWSCERILSMGWPEDPKGKGIITRANADAHAHEEAKKIRRDRSRMYR